jgi:membrane protein implicated in regulation of membrane protease activity
MKIYDSTHVRFVQLHRPGRVSILIACVIVVAIIATCIFTMYEMLNTYIIPVLNTYIIPVIIALPFAVILFDSFFRKRLLPRGKPRCELGSQLKKLTLRWLLKRSGRGVKGWNRVGLGLPRTIADSSLQEQLSKVTIPDGLVEPEQITTSKPGSLFGCIFGVGFSMFIIWVMTFSVGRVVMTLSVGGVSAKFVFWIVIGVLLWNIARLILGLPSVHRSRKLPAFLRVIGRQRMLSRPIVAGPGWVKLGRHVWRADRDMFLIRRAGFRLASSEIDCMFAGPEKRRRMTFSGITDEDFQLLYGFWNVNEVRLEFVDSNIA